MTCQTQTPDQTQDQTQNQTQAAGRFDSLISRILAAGDRLERRLPEGDSAKALASLAYMSKFTRSGTPLGRLVVDTDELPNDYSVIVGDSSLQIEAYVTWYKTWLQTLGKEDPACATVEEYSHLIVETFDQTTRLFMGLRVLLLRAVHVAERATVNSQDAIRQAFSDDAPSATLHISMDAPTSTRELALVFREYLVCCMREFEGVTATLKNRDDAERDLMLGAALKVVAEATRVYHDGVSPALKLVFDPYVQDALVATLVSSCVRACENEEPVSPDTLAEIFATWYAYTRKAAGAALEEGHACLMVTAAGTPCASFALREGYAPGQGLQEPLAIAADLSKPQFLLPALNGLLGFEREMTEVIAGFQKHKARRELDKQCEAQHQHVEELAAATAADDGNAQLFDEYQKAHALLMELRDKLEAL